MRPGVRLSEDQRGEQYPGDLVSKCRCTQGVALPEVCAGMENPTWLTQVYGVRSRQVTENVPAHARTGRNGKNDSDTRLAGADIVVGPAAMLKWRTHLMKGVQRYGWRECAP